MSYITGILPSSYFNEVQCGNLNNLWGRNGVKYSFFGGSFFRITTDNCFYLGVSRIRDRGKAIRKIIFTCRVYSKFYIIIFWPRQMNFFSFFELFVTHPLLMTQSLMLYIYPWTITHPDTHPGWKRTFGPQSLIVMISYSLA